MVVPVELHLHLRSTGLAISKILLGFPSLIYLENAVPCQYLTIASLLLHPVQGPTAARVVLA